MSLNHGKEVVRKLFTSGHFEDGRKNNVNNEDNDSFRVFLRIKPNSEVNNVNDCIRIEDSIKLICKPPPTSKHKKLEKVEYTFSHIFGPKTSQHEIFSKSVVDCIKEVLNMRNGLIFAYGTTNAGKTYTVQGSKKNPGIIPHALHTIFSNIQVNSKIPYKPYMARDLIEISLETGYEEIGIRNEILKSFQTSCKSTYQDSSDFMQSIRGHSIELGDTKPSCCVWISFLEVYNEMIYDLLDSKVTSRKPLKIAANSDDNFYVKELKLVYASSAEEAFTIYQYGRRNLNVASTKMNENSSRSHCIFTIHVINLEEKDNPYVSKLCICDLAGTERVSNTQSTGLRLKESGNINGSLFQLNHCLRAIRENQTKGTKQRIPYRHSNLTKLLQSALNDRVDEKVVMIVNINPSAELYDETQQVLKVCAIASKIKHKPLAHTLKRSTRFSSLLYGRETNFASQDYTPLEELPELEESAEDCDDEVQGLLETLHQRNNEIKRLEERIQLIEESHEKRKKMLQEYAEKVEAIYKNKVARLEERLKSQKSYFLEKLDDTKKSIVLENIDETVRSELDEKNIRIQELESQISELLYNKTSCTADLNNSIVKTEISKKNTVIEELEKKIAEFEPKITESEQKITDLEKELENRNLSFLEKIDEKDTRIKDLESLTQEAREEYLSLEKMFESEKVKIHELEEELNDKNETIEQLGDQLEEKEDKITRLETILSENTIEHEQILLQIEKDRDIRLAEYQARIFKLETQVEHLLVENRDKDIVLNGLRNEIEELKKENDQIRRNNRVEESRVVISEVDPLTNVQKSNQDNEETVKRLLSELLSKNQIETERDTRLAECQSSITEFETRVEHLLKENNDKDKILDDLRNEIEEVKKERDVLRKRDEENAAARVDEVKKLEKRLIQPSKLAVEEPTTEVVIRLQRLRISEADPREKSNQDPDENVIPRRYNTRAATHKTPGKENQPPVRETPREKTSRKKTPKGRTPLGDSVLEDSSDVNVFRNTVEKGKTPDRRQMAKIKMQKLFSPSPSRDLSETTQPHTCEKKKLFSISPSADCLLSDYEIEEDTSRYRRTTFATPRQVVNLTKKKK